MSTAFAYKLPGSLANAVHLVNGFINPEKLIKIDFNFNLKFDEIVVKLRFLSKFCEDQFSDEIRDILNRPIFRECAKLLTIRRRKSMTNIFMIFKSDMSLSS